MSSEQQDDLYILGSAEPFSPEETEARLRELEAWGVDLTLARASLARTPTERVLRMIDLLDFAESLRRGYVSRQGSASTESTTEQQP